MNGEREGAESSSDRSSELTKSGDDADSDELWVASTRDESSADDGNDDADGGAASSSLLSGLWGKLKQPESNVMKQHQFLAAFDTAPSVEEVVSARSRAVESLCKTLNDAALWDAMYERRVQFSYTFEYAALSPDAKRWVHRLLHYQHKHRRAIWERQHWVYLWRDETATANMTKERRRRSQRQARALNVWLEVRVEGAKLVKSGLLSEDVWSEPFMWRFRDKPLWLADGCAALADVAEVDAAEPERTYHVDDLPSHRFHKSKMDVKSPQRFLLPGTI